MRYAIYDEITLLMVNYCLFVFTEWGTVEQTIIMGNFVVSLVNAYMVVFGLTFVFVALLILAKHIKRIYIVYKIK